MLQTFDVLCMNETVKLCSKEIKYNFPSIPHYEFSKGWPKSTSIHLMEVSLCQKNLLVYILGKHTLHEHTKIQQLPHHHNGTSFLGKRRLLFKKSDTTSSKKRAFIQQNLFNEKIHAKSMQNKGQVTAKEQTRLNFGWQS